MKPEICIPTDRVPPEILQRLKEIGLQIQSEASPSAVLASTAAPGTLVGIVKKDRDECDNLGGSDCRRQAVVHVLSQNREKEKEKKKDNDVVSLFEREARTECEVVGVLDRTDGGDAGRGYDARRDNDVVSLIDHHRPSPSGSNPGVGGVEVGKKEGFQNRSSPLKDVMNYSSRPSQPLPQPRAHSPMQPGPPASPHSGHQFPAMRYAHQADASDHLLLPSPRLLPLSHFKPQCVEEAEEDRRILNNRSPCKTPKRCEDPTRPLHSPFRHLAQSPSMSEASSGTLIATTTSSSSQSSRSRSSPSQQSCSSDDDFLRGFSLGCVTPSKDSAQKSPKVLTPPETPENDGKRVVPEVFTFDEMTCSQEQLRQTLERLSKLHDQFTPTKRSPSTPRHPPSSPTTPSFRLFEVQASPTVTRQSPVDPRYLQRMEASSASSATGSPKSRLKASDMSMSLAPTSEDFPQRRDSLSPKPKKRLSFDEETLPAPQLFQGHRSRTFDTTASPYSQPSQRPGGSSSENPFSFPVYPVEGQHFVERGASSRSALTLAEFQKRMTSLAAFPEGREEEHVEEEEEEEGEGGGRGSFFSGTRHIYESIEFQNRMAMQSGRCTPKRKRTEPLDDGNDGMAVCTCAVMERDFLKMAECAYKMIRRMDTTSADFDRFRNELAQTNEILRESMGLMKHIRDLCDHRKRPRR